MPASQVTFEGAEVQFSVSASSAEALTYQWFKDEKPLARYLTTRNLGDTLISNQ